MTGDETAEHLGQCSGAPRGVDVGAGAAWRSTPRGRPRAKTLRRDLGRV
jgi:hypothetical protein